MTHLRFEWDELNIAHLARHSIIPSEAEQVMLNRPIDLGTELRNGEERFAQVGETNSGRILIVITMHPNDGMVRVVTAWPAKKRLQRYFGSHKEAGNAGRTEDQDIRD